MRAKIELAQDVARFANGDVSAILVVGLRTAKEDGRDVVRVVTPEKMAALSVEQHQDVIDGHVVPAVEGLTVESVDMGDGKGLLMIGVPAQPTEHKPFLVHGAVVGDRVERVRSSASSDAGVRGRSSATGEPGSRPARGSRALDVPRDP